MSRDILTHWMQRPDEELLGYHPLDDGQDREDAPPVVVEWRQRTRRGLQGLGDDVDEEAAL